MKNLLQINLIKLDPKSFEEVVDKQLYLKRIKRSKLNTFIDFQDQLLYKFINSNLAVGDIIADDNNLELLKQMGSLVPVLNNGEESTLDVDQILDYEDCYLEVLTRLFFTQSIDDEDFTDPNSPYRPSLIAEFNQLDYGGQLGKNAEKIAEEENQKNQKKQKNQN